MIIDSHTHVYPGKVADKIRSVFERNGTVYSPMTVNGVISSMEKAGVDYSFTFNVASTPDSVSAANDFVIKGLGDKRLIGFGTMHPDFEAYGAEIDRLKANNIKRLKLHCLMQNFYIDEPRMFHIYGALEKRGMIAYFHCGKSRNDDVSPVRAAPEALSRLLALFPRLKVVAAHFGGLGMLQEAKKYLVGKEVYLDTSWVPSIEVLNPLEIANLIREHGSDRILFGTDYPMTPIRKQIDWIKALPLAEGEKEKILGKNAQQLVFPV